jgi:hypothetical protein
MNRKYILITSLIITCITASAQVPEDAIKYSFFPQNGTARNLAIGGANGSLGGDVNSVFVNPAGIGFFKTGEMVFTPAFSLNNNKVNYRETNSTNKYNKFNIGAIGFVYGEPTSRNGKSSHAFSLAFTQTANFNNTIQYSGLNNYSSYAEQWAEEVAKSGKTIDQVLNNAQYAYGSATALYTYLVDTVRVGNALQVKAAPEYILDAGQAIRQEMLQETKGGMYELAIGYAMNKNDKWYWGGSVGIPIVSMTSDTKFSEYDTSSRTNNHFKSFTYTDHYKTSGVGINGKFGVIYRPKDYIRLGLSLQTPSLMFLSDSRNSSLTASLENPVYNATISSSTFNGGGDGKAKYDQRSPWRAIISASYVFREVENVKKQRAFITADIEYVNHRGSRFSSDNNEPTQEEKDYYKALNDVVKNIYKGNFNFRVGGELKFNVVMARLGFAYYSNPYKETGLKASKTLLSGGLGYRNKGMFLDLTYVYNMSKDVNFPYRLEDRANTYATVKSNKGNVVATLGFKF